MSYISSYNSKTHVIESKFIQNLNFAEVKGFISDGALISKENNCPFFLSDYRQVRLKLSTMEIFKVPQIMQAEFSSLNLWVNRLKRAVVAAEDLEDYRFYENAAINRGQHLKVFTDINEAKKWLSESQRYYR